MRRLGAIIVVCLFGQLMMAALMAKSETGQQAMAITNLGSMPLAFTQNNGQWDERALFRADAGLATVWITKEGVYYQFIRRIPKPDDTSVGASHSPVFDDRFNLDKDVGQEPYAPDVALEERHPDSLEQMMIKASFVGANPITEAAGDQAMEYKCNYFLGNDPTKWRTDVPNYRAAVLKEVYPGIDLRYYGNGDGKLEYDFVVSPGADPSQIAVRYEGGKSVSVNAAGELVVETDWNTVVEQCPVVYQIDGDTRCAISGAYTLRGDNTFGFTLDETYDPALVLVIDPALVYSTYLGGSGGDDLGIGVAVDGSGCAYLTGYTSSHNFPLQNPYDSIYAGGYNDAFVTKLSASGNALVYSTYIVGSLDDEVRGIAIDNAGCAYLTGQTSSSDFPIQNPYDGSFNGGGNDAFIVKLSASGNALVYSTYLGGGNSDYGYGIAVDNAGCAYLTGQTWSSDFPIQNPYDDSLSGVIDAFVTKLSASGNVLVYSTYLGGESPDFGDGIALDASGYAYISGQTNSPDFPTQNQYQTFQGGWDAFVTKLGSTGNSLVYSTYLGGSNDEDVYGITVDESECAYITGETQSPDFPTLAPYQTDQGGPDAFVTKLSTSGNSLIYSTYLGGSSADAAFDIAVDDDGCAYVTGITWSTDFPLQNPYQTDQGSTDAFVTKLSAAGNSLIYTTYLGGTDYDEGHGIAVDGSGCAYVTGKTVSPDFPTQNRYQTYQGNEDAFIFKLDNPTNVFSLVDSGPGSFRQAIDAANAGNGPDTITFAVSGTIALQSPLPALVDDSTVILGSTAPGGDWSVVLDGTGISGGGDGLVVQSRDNLIEGLTIKNFPGNGISVTGALSIRNKITANRIYNNNGLAIDLGADGVTANDVGDGDTGPNDLLNFPIIDSAACHADGSYTMYGTAVEAEVVEAYIAHPTGDTSRLPDPSNHGEAYFFIDSVQVPVPATGEFEMPIPASVGHYSVVTLLARDTLGNTSEFSEDATLAPRPLIVVAYSPVNIIITDPNSLRFGKDSLGNNITGIPDGHYFITPNDSVIIDHPMEGHYIVQFVTEAGIPAGATYSAIIQIDGTQQLIIAADKLCPASGKADTSIYKVEEGYHYKNGDGNRDNMLNVGDAVFVINYVFKGGPAPNPYLSADANCDRTVNIGDAVYVINFIFKGGHSPCYFEP